MKRLLIFPATVLPALAGDASDLAARLTKLETAESTRTESELQRRDLRTTIGANP